jgi:hypothetical protein
MRWHERDGTLRPREGGGSNRIERFTWDDVTSETLFRPIKGPSLNHRHRLLDRVNSYEFELWRLCKSVRCLAFEEQ